MLRSLLVWLLLSENSEQFHFTLEVTVSLKDFQQSVRLAESPAGCAGAGTWGEVHRWVGRGSSASPSECLVDKCRRSRRGQMHWLAGGGRQMRAWLQDVGLVSS